MLEEAGSQYNFYLFILISEYDLKRKMGELITFKLITCLYPIFFFLRVKTLPKMVLLDYGHHLHFMRDHNQLC